MKILVIGGTGTVGSHVVAELQKRDTEITVLSRKDKQEANLPHGVNHLKGNLSSPGTVRSMCKNMDAVFLLNVVSPTEAQEGLMAVNGIRMSNVKKVVYLSVYQADKAPHLPHFGAKLAVEAAVKAIGIPYTILRPNNYYQNDYFFKDTLLNHGVYPQPLGSAGVSQVDVRDIAEAAAILLTSDKHQHHTLNLVGPDANTGKGIAKVWSQVLNKDIFYAGDNLDAWEKQSLEYMPDWMVFDFRQMYYFFQTEGFKGTREDIRREADLLGHEPRSFEDFARETAEMWQKETVKK